MSDIVERLRAGGPNDIDGLLDLLEEAADEIERLRREVNLLKEQRTRLARGTEYTTSVENEVERLLAIIKDHEEERRVFQAEIQRLREENERLRAEVASLQHTLQSTIYEKEKVSSQS